MKNIGEMVNAIIDWIIAVAKKAFESLSKMK